MKISTKFLITSAIAAIALPLTAADCLDDGGAASCSDDTDCAEGEFCDLTNAVDGASGDEALGLCTVGDAGEGGGESGGEWLGEACGDRRVNPTLQLCGRISVQVTLVQFALRLGQRPHFGV